jgi:predicted transcriptional regulator
MARTAQISKEKQQSIITLRHEGQSIQNISRTLNVSSGAVAEPLSAMMKLAIVRTATGKEDPEFIGVNCISDCRRNKSSSN